MYLPHQVDFIICDSIQNRCNVVHVALHVYAVERINAAAPCSPRQNVMRWTGSAHIDDGIPKNSIEIELNKLHSERVAIAFNLFANEKLFTASTDGAMVANGWQCRGKGPNDILFHSLYSLSLERLSFSLLVLVSIWTAFRLYTQCSPCWDFGVVDRMWMGIGWTIWCRCRRLLVYMEFFFVAYIISMCVEANVCAKKKLRIFNFVVTMTTDKRCSILTVCNTPKSIVCLNRHENRTKIFRKKNAMEREGKILFHFAKTVCRNIYTYAIAFSLVNIRYIDFYEWNRRIFNELFFIFGALLWIVTSDSTCICIF